MGTSSVIFYLFMFTFLAALGYAALQVFKTNKSQERHGDDKRALTHRLQREQAELEQEMADKGIAEGPGAGLAGDDKRMQQRRMSEKQAAAEVERERHTGAINPA